MLNPCILLLYERILSLPPKSLLPPPTTKKEAQHKTYLLLCKYFPDFKKLFLLWLRLTPSLLNLGLKMYIPQRLKKKSAHRQEWRPMGVTLFARVCIDFCNNPYPSP
jgi:hypothetical protein